MTRDDLIAALMLHAIQCPEDAAHIRSFVEQLRMKDSTGVQSFGIAPNIEQAAAYRIAKAVNPNWRPGSEFDEEILNDGAWASSPFLDGHAHPVRHLRLRWINK